MYWMRSSLCHVLLIWLCAVTLGQAQEFRIKTEMFVGDAETPLARNLTLFTDSLICDFRMSDADDSRPVEVAMLDTRQKKFILLDLERNVRTEITDLQLEKLVENLAGETQADDRSKFLISDNFTEETDWSTNRLQLKSENLDYHFQGSQPEDAAVLPQYFMFLDHFTKLNASDPKKMPPFPRMKLNQRIKQLGWFPAEIRVKLRANQLFRESLEVRTTHRLIMGLTKQDRELLANSKIGCTQLKLVDLPEFRQVREDSGNLVRKMAVKPNSETSNQ